MSDYKLLTNGNVYHIPTGTAFGNGSALLWEQYQAFLDGGGVPDPELSGDELRESLDYLIRQEANKRVDAVTSELPRERMFDLMYALVLINKKADGTILTNEENIALNSLIAKSESIIQIVGVKKQWLAWISAPERTYADLLNFDETAIDWG